MSMRPAWAEIDLRAVRDNVAALRRASEPAALCAVVKADGYGHGAARVARAAVEGGAAWLGVALVEEGLQLRAAGIDAPILLLSEPAPAAMNEVVAGRLTPTLYTVGGVAAAARAVVDATAGVLNVHVKVDTGMHRVGADPEAAVALAADIAARPQLRLAAMFTHLAVADEESGAEFTAEQGRRFAAVVEKVRAGGIDVPLVHVCNSAGALRHPSLRCDMVRCGIAVYGLAPAAELRGEAETLGLRPVLSLKARVSHVKRVAAGDRASYGLRYRFESDATVATVPLGYADGVPRRLFPGGEVLVGGRRRPIAGTVTMDQVVVDCGDDVVMVGDEVVFLGAQGDERVDAWEWAERVGTIAYEVLCGIGPRVPRIPVG